ncbi:unnamed protein product [Rhizoctonia solani]|uniref:GPI mannosyltransferase 2 n=1 Tax=Rhizoctonia solani TaxID=456999 RepID=A0A8H2WEN7_9AGAM|nr:unnamed protein product [Rhizoctonia solani]
MERPFSKLRLRIYFFICALICQLVAPIIPAFDTSHLVPLKPSSNLPHSTMLPGFSQASQTTDHQIDLSRYPLQLIPSAGLRWDALHYLDVALSGTYTYEHQYAFSPGVPIILRLAHTGKELVYNLVSSPSLLRLTNIQLRSTLVELVNAFLVAMLAVQPGLALYDLTERITHSREFSFLTLLVHVILGAPPVIIRSAYAEPFFAWFTFEGLSSYHQQKYLAASLYFGLATAFRTNGIILPCFLVYGLLVQPLFSGLLTNLKNYPSARLADLPKGLYNIFRELNCTRTIYCLILVIISLSPFIAQQYIAYITFCQPPSPRPWCSSRVPLVYSFVQSHYWDVGPWRYWTPAQIPNFLLAMPILTLAFSSVALFFMVANRAIRPKQKMLDSSSDLALSPSMMLTLLPYAIHALVLSLMLFIAAHVQIALRVLPAGTPWISWAGASLIIQSVKHRGDVAERKESSGANSRGGSWWPFLSNLWLWWSVVWVFVSSVLWLAFLPPA